MSKADFRDSDPVDPALIEHRCEEIWSGESLEQVYNYLVYRFDIDGLHYWARAYLDEIDEVSITTASADLEGLAPQPMGGPPTAMLGYLKRRYRRITVLGPKGYQPIWEA